MENHCVCCGSVIPEGRQVYRECETESIDKRSFPGIKIKTIKEYDNDSPNLWGIRKSEKENAENK